MAKNTTFDLRTAAESQLEAIAHIASQRSLCATPAEIEKTRRILTNLTFALQATLITWELAEADTSATLPEQIC